MYASGTMVNHGDANTNGAPCILNPPLLRDHDDHDDHDGDDGDDDSSNGAPSILNPPLLRDVYDPDEHTQVRKLRFKKISTCLDTNVPILNWWFLLQRWRLLLTLSLVNIFYIICGFLLNFKVLSIKPSALI